MSLCIVPHPPDTLGRTDGRATGSIRVNKEASGFGGDLFFVASFVASFVDKARDKDVTQMHRMLHRNDLIRTTEMGSCTCERGRAPSAETVPGEVWHGVLIDDLRTAD